MNTQSTVFAPGEVEEAKPAPKPRPHCRGKDVNDNPCPWKASMTWFGVPFCASHAPRRRHGLGGWERLR